MGKKYLILIVLLVPFLLNVQVIQAKTINDLKNELTKMEQDSKNNDNKIVYTEQQIEASKNAISSIYIEIDQMNKEIDQKTKEIEQLTVEIESRDDEIKSLMHFFQLSNGESSYLEFLLGAKSLTDLVYRLSIVEQLSKYNSEKINEMNDMIEKNEQRKVELKNKQVELANKQVELSRKIQQLGMERQKLYEYDRSLDDEIKNARDVINMYVNAGCGLTEEISLCANRLLPPDTKFWRPMTRGYSTSEFGYRIHPISGVRQFHTGIDLSNSDKYNTSIYAVANGKVAKTFYDSSGGNQVVVHHRIFNGSTYINYSSTYLHLKTILVKDGQLVDKNSVIGIMGTTGNSTGPHLHLSISTGHRYKDYVSYSDFIARIINPRTVINIPSPSIYWFDRMTRY